MKTRLLILSMVLINAISFGQLKLTLQAIQPTCVKSPGYHYREQGDGTILATVTGGIPPYYFTAYGRYGLYTGTQNNGYFPGLIEGIYYITVYDAARQSVQQSATLVAASPTPSLNLVSFTNASGCNGNDGNAQLQAIGGTPPYQYSIDGGVNYQPSGTFNNLRCGYYYSLVRDANGCIQSWEGSGGPYPLYVPIGYKNNTCNITLATLSYGDFGTGCINDGSGKASAVYNKGVNGNFLGDANNLMFSSDGINFHRPNKSVAAGNAVDTFSGLSPGLHDYYLKDTVTGLTASTTFNVVRACDVYIDYIFVEASCGESDGALTVMVKNGGPPFTYSMDGISFQTSNIFTGLASGTYSVSVKDANGDIVASKATVYNKCPVVRATTTNESCNQQDGTILAHGYLGTQVYRFSLDNINYQSDSLFTKLPQNTYTVYIKDANGFIDSITNINVLGTCLKVTATATNENCNHADGIITATGFGGTLPYTYSIDGINFKLSNTFTNLTHNNYTITIRDASLLTATVQQIIVNTPPPIINLGNDSTLCIGQKLNLSLNIPNTSYKWQDGSTNSSFTVLQAGKYWVTANVNGCFASDTINVSYLNLGKIFTTADTIACIGSTITLNAGHAGATFLWDDGSSNQTRTVNTNGKYWVKVSSSRCSISDTITSHFVPPPIIVFPSDTSFCNTQQLILNAGNINATYLWNDGTVGSTLVVKKAGTYVVAATANGCTSFDTIKVAIKPNPQIALGNDTTLCTGQTVTLNATDKNANSNATYIWQDGFKSPLYTVNKQGNYLVKVAANGCDTTGKITITYTTKAIVNLGFDTTLCNTQQLVLDATYPKSNYLWQDGSTKAGFTVTQAGIYKVDVTNYCGTVSDSIAVQYENCDCVFYIPSAFSPNGDGKNDIFKPSYQCLFANYKLNVYSRFGKIIFTSSNADNGWDGLINGEQQPAGVYVWEISYLDTFTNKAVKRNGTMVLVR